VFVGVGGGGTISLVLTYYYDWTLPLLVSTTGVIIIEKINTTSTKFKEPKVQALLVILGWGSQSCF